MNTVDKKLITAIRDKNIVVAMTKKIISLILAVIIASYIIYLGIGFRDTDYNIFISLVFISLFMCTYAGIDLILAIRKNKKPD